MAAATTCAQAISALPELPAAYWEPRWYAAYTCANHEKQVAAQMLERGVEHFLPLYEALHRWKDRRVRLHLPLFPGYVFTRLPLRDRLEILRLPSVVRLVGFGRLPTALPEQEIETLRAGLSSGLRAQPHPYLALGRRVRIRNGPLAGLEGILQRRKGKFRVVLSVDLIMRSIAVEADIVDLGVYAQAGAANRG
jgi:transcription antitermination factor NusG